ncbi:hypothetical protein DKT77_04610 [Meridianimarinicoccus roseus]|uniref:Uncharacterized protein n=1 Tax=Meridianimarinicoccus roseus TaxID=2072018 RepID=A0A2V2LJY3_9RHOB|nr:hypothetical protein [Meridianimarinicoccus roseus]PWR03794.1 hypothetical protein DKT77_04610 [Meridianimarinicoccus roseus]
MGLLIDEGMAPGAVWALARTPVFALYIALSLTGAFAAGITIQVWSFSWTPFPLTFPRGRTPLIAPARTRTPRDSVTGLR